MQTPHSLHVPVYPLGYREDVAPQPWFAAYPPGCRGLIYPEIRIEQFLEIAARHHPQRIAVIYAKTQWSYRELRERVLQVAGRLRDFGITAGDRVLFAMPNSPEYVVAWFALHYLGAEIVHGSPLNSAHELVRLAEMTKPVAAFGLDLRLRPLLQMTKQYPLRHLFVASLAPHLPLHLRAAYGLRNILAGRSRAGNDTTLHPFSELRLRGAPLAGPVLEDSDRPAVLQPTGGTTGTPKVVSLTHRNIVTNVAQNHPLTNRQSGREVILAVLPFFHVYGSTTVLVSGVSGATTLLLQPRFDARRVLKECNLHRATIATMVPFMFAALLQEMKRTKQRLESVEMAISGSCALDPKVAAGFKELTGLTILEGYGLSEAAPVTHSNPVLAPRPGTIGVPLPDTLARIVDTETGLHEMPVGEVGELVVRGPQVMSCYLDAADETARALRDGWLFTGDLATMDGEGYFTIVDRKKDMIKTGGLNVYPSEVEAVIATFPGVQQCAVVGEPDEKWGERVVAWIVPAPGATLSIARLSEFCREELAHYKAPKEFRTCAMLPTNLLGKVRRAELRQQGASAAPSP